MKENVYRRCCVCDKFRAVADSDKKNLYGCLTIIYFCAPCLGLEEEVVEVEVEVEERIAVSCLTAKEIHAIAGSVAAIVVRALTTKGQSKTEINEAIRKAHDSFLRPQSLEKALRALKWAGVVETAGRRGLLETYRLVETDCSEAQEKSAQMAAGQFRRLNSQQLAAKEIKAMGQTPGSIVLDAIAKGAGTRKQINQAINVRWLAYLRHDLLERAILKLVKEGAIVASGHGSEQRYYITAKRRLAGGAA